MDETRFRIERASAAAEAFESAYDRWDAAVERVLAECQSLTREQAEAEQRRRDRCELWHAMRTAEINSFAPPARIW